MNSYLLIFLASPLPHAFYSTATRPQNKPVTLNLLSLTSPDLSEYSIFMSIQLIHHSFFINDITSLIIRSSLLHLT